ncbi:MAG: TerB family tellurite resistance protein [Proteobacteria bacterium]|nr:TerB family tellurite resistance protein [Pseudomonadota bacterium]MDA1064107.1 TerB family tellurite resistance protein [Pseudomonadota bacterium]
MTLARAADVDINIQNIEVERIQQILKHHTGEKFSAKDIRMAARAELYAEATLRKYLLAVGKKLRSKDRRDIVHALTEVFRSDSEVSVLEIDFFNGVVRALRATPAEIAGLASGDVK